MSADNNINDIVSDNSHDKYDNLNERGLSNLNLVFGDPLNLHPNDISPTSLINFKLIGTENYNMWSYAMKFALRNKIKLDDVYQPNKSNILTRDPLPLVKTAFAVVLRDESYKNVTSCSVSKVSFVTVFAAKGTFVYGSVQFNMNFEKFFNGTLQGQGYKSFLTIVGDYSRAPNPKRPDDEGRVPSNNDGTKSNPINESNGDSVATFIEDNAYSHGNTESINKSDESEG
ncbi:hypothetical protein Tco_0191456 [Tanacetum coccineum]